MSHTNQKSSSHHSKPPLSYIALITLAIKNSPLQMVTLNEVYQYIIATFPYFQENREKWQNTVRHNLSLNDCFIKIPRRFLGIPGKGNFWALHPHAGGMFNHGSLLRRRRRFRTQSSFERSRSSSPGYDDTSRPERNSASIHHIDSKHHFDLYGAQKNIDLAREGLMMLYSRKSQDRSLVPSPQYSLPPHNHHALYGWNVFPNYQIHPYKFSKY